MKKYIFIILLFLTNSGYCQWEQIGWRGGKIAIVGQLGNTLYGTSSGLPTPNRPDAGTSRKSTDWGKTWTVFNKGLPITTASGPFYRRDPKGLNTVGDSIFLLSPTTSEYRSLFGTGIYYTKENDDEWKFKPLSPMEQWYPPTDGSRYLFIGGDTIILTSGFCFFSSDAGATWQRRMEGLNELGNFVLSAPVRSQNRLLASYKFKESIQGTHDSTLLYRSTNLGMHWELLQTPFSTELYQLLWKTKEGVILLGTYTNSSYYDSDGLFYTTDFGDSWRKITLPIVSDSTSWVVRWVKSIGEKVFLSAAVAGANYLFVSDDFGIHWRSITVPDPNIRVNEIYGEENHYIIEQIEYLYTGYPKYYQTDSSFTEFDPVYFNTYNPQDDKLLVFVKDRSLFGTQPDGTQDELTDSIFVSNDNGDSWGKRLLCDSFIIDIHPKWCERGENIYLAAYNIYNMLGHFPVYYREGCILRSTDNGSSWSRYITSPYLGKIMSFMVSGDTFFIKTRYTDSAGHSVDTAAMTSDVGSTWTILRGPKFQNTGPDFYPDKSLTAWDGNGHRGYSYDLGASWQFLVDPDDVNSTTMKIIRLGGRWFHQTVDQYVTKSFGLFRLDENKYWTRCEGFTSERTLLPTYFENGLMLGVLSPETSNYISGIPYDGRDAVYVSLDTGATWKMSNGFLTRAKDLFAGSDYYFVYGLGEIWRLPKSLLSVVRLGNTNTSETAISSAYPNPVNKLMRIQYLVPKSGLVRIAAYNSRGDRVQLLVDEFATDGAYEITWDVERIPSGMYVLELVTQDGRITKPVQVVK